MAQTKLLDALPANLFREQNHDTHQVIGCSAFLPFWRTETWYRLSYWLLSLPAILGDTLMTQTKLLVVQPSCLFERKN